MTNRLVIAAAIGILQGVGLYWLGERSAPVSADERALATALWAALLFGPLTLQLSLDQADRFRFWLVALPLVALLAGMGAYAAWSLTLEPPLPYSPAEQLQIYYWIAAAFVWFVAFPLLRSERDAGGSAYGSWYETATTTPFLLAQAALFAGIGWLLIELSAALFDLIGIDVIEQATDESFVVLPTLCMLAGIGAQALAPNVVVWMRRHLLTLLAWLLPIAAAIAVLFLCALAFTGLQPLWETGTATILLVSLQSALILLVNAAWQDGSQPAPFPRWLRRALGLSLLTLPFYAALSVYSLALRVEQYGWTVERLWAALVVAAIALLGIGYVLGLLARGETWLPRMGLVNLLAFGAVAVLLVLFHTPPLDPKMISANAQAKRLLASRVAAEEFDFGYLRFGLGRPGIDALARLATVTDHPEAAIIRERVAAVRAETKPWYSEQPPWMNAGLLTPKLLPIPAGRELDPAFIETVATALRSDTNPLFLNCLDTGPGCRVLLVDLNADGGEDYVLVDGCGYWRVFGRSGAGWATVGTLGGPCLDASMAPALDGGRAEAVKPEWSDLRIGATLFDFTPWRE